MKSFSKLVLLALAFYTTTAQAQTSAAQKTVKTAPAQSTVKNYYVVKLWHPSDKLTAQDQQSLKTINSTWKGKHVSVMNVQYNNQSELYGILRKFFADVQVDPENENNFKVNGSSIEFSKKKGTLLIADDHLVMASFTSDQEINTYLQGAVK
jgi:hypothetical protein